MSDAQHRKLLAVISGLPCAVMISGYPSAMYDQALRGWQREQFRVMTRGHTWATEVLWFNYERPAVPHDLGYVGRNYRERLRIRRKRARWRAKFEKLGEHERAVLIAALVDVMGASAAASVVRGVDAGAAFARANTSIV